MVGKYPTYSAYKNSGVELLGNIPEGWKAVRLKHTVEQSRQITYGIVQAGPNLNVGIPYIRPADMTDEKGIREFSGLMRTSPQIASDYERSKIKAGDLVCSIGPSFGKVMLVPDTLSGANLTQGTARIAIAPENSSKFIFWVLRSPITFQQWESSVGGATFRALNLGPLAETHLSLPPLPEQTQIAAFLDHETAKIDALIAKQERLIALLEEKRQAVISHAVTKGLNPDAPLRPSGLDWLGDVPAHWGVCRLKHVKAKEANAFVDGPFGSNLKSEHFSPEGEVFVIESSFATTGEIRTSELKKISRQHFETIKRSAAKGGDIIIAKIGARYGMSSILPELDGEAVVSGNSLKLTVDSELVLNSFALELLRHLKIQEAMDENVNVTAQPALSLGGLNNLPFLKVPLMEQEAIVEFLQRNTEFFEGLLAKAQSAITLLKERRTALISAAVTGKIDVRDWQPPKDISDQDTEQKAFV